MLVIKAADSQMTSGIVCLLPSLYVHYALVVANVLPPSTISSQWTFLQLSYLLSF